MHAAVCDRDGYFDSVDPPLHITYDTRKIDPERLPDVVHTCECFANSWLEPPTDKHLPGARIAQPLVLVKPRVHAILRRQRVYGIAADPVRFA